MVRNLYFRNVYKRTNVFKEAMLGAFLGFSSWPRLLLEVWIRRNFGRRYFSLSGSIAAATLLGLYPIVFAYGRNEASRYGYGDPFDLVMFIQHYITWYAFLLGFLYMANERRREIVTIAAQFDLNHFSLSTGVIHPRFLKIEINGQPASLRLIETLLEPASFFAIGLGLFILSQPIGLVIMMCAVIYGMSYQAQYYLSDSFILDKIDEMIANRNFIAAFVDGKDASETEGFRVNGRRPADPDFRRELANSFLSKDEIYVAA